MSDPLNDPFLLELDGVELLREIGRGGSSVVYEARHRERGLVAVKVLTDDAADTRAAFERERVLAGRIADTAIVPIHELVRTERGVLAYIMELVDGATLEDLIARGEAPRSRAVAIVASAARALASVHDAGIIHRDVKPQNILVDKAGRVRLLDFGIAKDLRDATVVDDPELIVGTPSYLSPEQAQSYDSTPATDIWGLGVVLYELLTGALPFDRKDLSELIRAIVREPPPAPRTLNPAIGPALEAIVLCCLEKAPARRFQTGAELASVLESQLAGTPDDALIPVVLARFGKPGSAQRTPPPPKPRREDARIRHRWEWELEASPDLLWPLVSDTERFNQAIGLPPVEWTVEPDGQGDVTRIGAFRRLGLRIEWLEHPYEWVAPREQSVLRMYRKGPIETLWSRVRLTPRGQGTTLVHEVWMQPRGALGRIAAFIEMSLGTKQRIDKVYRAFDATAVARGRARASDGLASSRKEPALPRLSNDGEAALSRKVERLEATGAPWAHLARPLEAELRDATDLDVARLRPYALAKRWGARRRVSLALCVAATRAAILETSWHLLCPTCRVPVATLPSLASVRRTSHCDTCDIDYANDLASSIELVFRPSAAVRPTGAERYCPGGPGHYRHVVAQQELDPGETRTFEVLLLPGSYRISARGIRQVFELRSSASGATSEVEVDLEEATLHGGPFAVRPGPVKVVLHNASKRRRLVRVESSGWREEPLTALEACGNPDLRALVSDLAPGEPVQVGQAAYLTAAPGERATPQAAVALATIFTEVTAESGGALVPREPLFAAFASEAAAIEAALRLHETVRRDGVHGGAPIRVAVHTGPSVASAVGGGLGYEGPAPDLAVALLDECQPGEIATTHLVLGEAAVRELVGTRETRVQLRDLGREGQVPVIYLRA